MILVFSVCAADLDKAVEIADWIVALGPQRAHSCVLMFPAELSISPTDAAKIQILSDALVPVFKRVIEYPVDAVPTGKFIVPNYMLKMAALKMMEFANLPEFAQDDGWYFFEPDCTPLFAGWLDAVAAEYRDAVARGFAFLGSVTDNGTMPRSAVYHVATFASVASIRQLSLQVPAQQELRKEIGSVAMPASTLQDNQSSRDYVRAAQGVLRCRTMPGHKEARNHPVQTTVAVVHGCKDGSLLRLLREERELNLIDPEGRR